jgi:hypothetical protein
MVGNHSPQAVDARCTVVDTTAGRKKPRYGADLISGFTGDSGNAAPAHQQGVGFHHAERFPSPRLPVLPLKECVCGGITIS